MDNNLEELLNNVEGKTRNKFSLKRALIGTVAVLALAGIAVFLGKEFVNSRTVQEVMQIQVLDEKLYSQTTIKEIQDGSGYNYGQFLEVEGNVTSGMYYSEDVPFWYSSVNAGIYPNNLVVWIEDEGRKLMGWARSAKAVDDYNNASEVLDGDEIEGIRHYYRGRAILRGFVNESTVGNAVPNLVLHSAEFRVPIKSILEEDLKKYSTWKKEGEYFTQKYNLSDEGL